MCADCRARPRRAPTGRTIVTNSSGDLCTICVVRCFPKLPPGPGPEVASKPRWSLCSLYDQDYTRPSPRPISLHTANSRTHLLGRSDMHFQKGFYYAFLCTRDCITQGNPCAVLKCAYSKLPEGPLWKYELTSANCVDQDFFLASWPWCL